MDRPVHRKLLPLLLGPALFVLVRWGFHPDLAGIDGLPKTASAGAAASAAAVTAWVAAWWFTEPVPIPAASLLPLVLLPLAGVLAPKEVSRQYTDHLIFLFLGGFLLALAMERSGVHRRLALSVLRRLGGSHRTLVLGFMAVTAFVSMWISNTAAMLMMVPVGLAVVNHLAERAPDAPSRRLRLDLGEEGRADLEAGDLPESIRPFAAALVLGLAYAANIGGLGTPVGTPPNLLFQQVYGDLSGQSVSFLGWMALGVPAAALALPAAWWVLVRRLPEGSGRAGVRAGDALKGAAPGPWSAAEKWVLGLFAATAMLWITRADIGDLAGWASRLGLAGRVEDSTVAIAAALLLFVVHTRERGAWRPLLTWGEAGRVPWGSLLLLGAGFALSEAFQASGLSHWIGGALGRAHGATSGASLALLLVGMLVVVTLLTEVASNTACAAILLPVLFALGARLDLPDPLVRLGLMGAAMACSNGFIAPAGTAPNAIAYATGHVPIGTFVRAGVLTDLLGVAVIGGVVAVAAVWGG